MTKLQIKANQRATDAVANYRQASAAKKADGLQPVPNRGYRAAQQMLMDKASGEIDALHALFPNLPAWTDTGWTH